MTQSIQSTAIIAVISQKMEWLDMLRGARFGVIPYVRRLAAVSQEGFEIVSPFTGHNGTRYDTITFKLFESSLPRATIGYVFEGYVTYCVELFDEEAALFGSRCRSSHIAELSYGIRTLEYPVLRSWTREQLSEILKKIIDAGDVSVFGEKPERKVRHE